MNYSKNYPWVAVGLLWMVALLNYLDRQMLATMKPAMQIDIEELQSATNFGYLMAVFLWIYGLMSPVSGIIADRLNKKWLIIGSLFVWSLVTLLMGFAQTYNQLYALRALMGISEALYIPAGLALIAGLHGDKTRSLAIGLHMTGLYLGQALGGFGATIAASFSWQTTFQTFGLVGVVYAMVLVLFLKNDAEPTPVTTLTRLPRWTDVFGGVSILVVNISFWIILFCFTIPSLPGWAIKNWLPTLFSENLHIDMTLAGPYSTITTAGSSLLGVIFGGLLADRWSQTNLRGRIYTSAIGLGLTIPALILIGSGHTLIHIIGAAFCFGFGFGMFDANNMPIICQFVAARHRATAYGLMNMTGIFAGAVITNVLGRSTDAGTLGSSFAVLAAFVLIAISLQLIFLRPSTNNYQLK
ncbi:MAG: MFS transporter [Saprospiraceae bacterium]|jgi:MFS family permease|nr:MFS transporter [Saprospiraceae bacterium]MBK6478201.1 MFS transporter [Saprospiraceae bacterium]MBK6817645.1 MFS transporter [Saprospiraceae bacterium]MBK7373017.1 MFS transporter [Saprospiraceae bacterium]MBK7439780.1 MFS transporter [Saprospiraceae bacterium]